VAKYQVSDEVRALFRETADFAAADMLQRIYKFTDKKGSLNFNGVLHEVIPVAIMKFLMCCPEQELISMAAELREAKRRAEDEE
jgi:hypothetical protein